MAPRLLQCCCLIYACILLFLFDNIVAKSQDDSKSQLFNNLQNKSDAGSDSLYKQMTGQAANLLKRQFEDISCEELGLTALNEILDSLRPSSRIITDEDLILTISERLLTKINTASQMLAEMKENIVNDSEIGSFTYPCPLNSYRKTHHLDTIEINSEKVTLNIPKNNYKSYIKNITKKYNVKFENQYFMSVQDGGTDQACGTLSSRTGSRSLMHQVLQPQRKRVLFIFEASNTASLDELQASVTITKEILNLLTPQDLIGFVYSTDKPQNVILIDKCLNETSSLGSAADNNKEIILKYLNNAEIPQNAPNITAGFQSVLDMLQDQDGASLVNTLIVYIGRKSSLLFEARNVWKVVSQFERDKKEKITLAGCSIEIFREENTEDVDPSQFLESDFEDGMNMLNSQWLFNFNTSLSPGQVASLILFKLPLQKSAASINAAPPMWDPKKKQSLGHFLLPLYIPVNTAGVLVLEMYLADISEDITYFNSFSPSHRAFILNYAGNVIAHSMFPRLELVVTKPQTMDISDLETSAQFENVKSNILHKLNGKMSTSEATYTWKWVKNLFIVCVVTENGNETIYKNGAKLFSGVPRELQHHRMDLVPPPNTPLCRHFLMLSTIHKGTLYLSPSSFQSPFSYLFDLSAGKDVSLSLMQSYMAFLKDNTRLLSNPGLKTEVRSDVGILNRMLSYFKRQHIRGAYNKYVVRRYAASERGVLVLFPGTILESDFEPNRKSWFSRATNNPGKIILTPPYLDIGGAGYIVTISQASGPGYDNSEPTIVLSIDITMRYLYKMLLDSMPLCAEANVRCFLMDDRGYLVSHPGLVDPPSSGPIEQTHVTREETHMANDMLNHKGFVQKKLCMNYADSTLQRYYQFNTSLDKILTNLVNGEHCARYHIASIHGTNAFVGIVNSTCRESAFCPCSAVDRLCLICNRMEQNECECPCECLLPQRNTCSTATNVVPLCEFESERNHRNNYYTRRYNLAPHLDSCFDFQCESYNVRSSCLGVLGCEWCQLDRDGETFLSSPFCTAQPTCFGGILGAPTPYEVGSFGQVTQDDLTPGYSAVGPIVGCIVALCLILALAVYCYKQNLTSAESIEPFPAPPDSWPRAGIQLNHIHSEDDIHDERSGHQDKLLLANEPVAPISPYRILTGYRRPNTAGESDHGYSTMTPHDDSEHQAFALVEPFLTQEGATAGSPALSTPRSSATDLPVTMLPCGKNNVIAPVTVHRHMEAT